MVSDKQLIEEYGIDAALVRALSERAAAYESGEWPSGKTKIGRPRTLGGDTVNITFRDSVAVRRAIDEKAKRLGISRSDYLRALVQNDLALSS